MEATVQTLSTSLTGEEPFIGDGSPGEIATNTADGRAWVFDDEGYPLELGGACVNKPSGNSLISCNYLSLDITNPDNLPVPVPNPELIPPGFYRELRILLQYVGTPLQTFSTYFDYEVDWGSSPSPDSLANTGATVLVELCSFGPSPKWIGRVIWNRQP